MASAYQKSLRTTNKELLLSLPLVVVVEVVVVVVVMVEVMVVVVVVQLSERTRTRSPKVLFNKGRRFVFGLVCDALAVGGGHYECDAKKSRPGGSQKNTPLGEANIE